MKPKKPACNNYFLLLLCQPEKKLLMEVTTFSPLESKVHLTLNLTCDNTYKYLIYVVARKFFRSFDFLFLMSYDLHGSWEKNVDLHGKLYPTKGETTGIGVFNTVSS